MNILQNILDTVADAEKEKKQLDTQDTLTILNAIKTISLDNLLLNTIIQLVLVIKDNEINKKSLTKRENEIFKLIGLGLTSREIGRLLSISEATVSTHRKKIIKKLKLTGSGQLQKLAYQHIQVN